MELSWRFFDSFNQGLIAVDEDLKIKYINHKASYLLNVSQTDFIDCQLGDLSKDTLIDNQLVEVVRVCMKENKVDILQRSLKHQSQGYSHIELKVKPEENGALLIFNPSLSNEFGISSSNYHSEDELLKKVVNKTSDGIIVISRERKVVSVNQTMRNYIFNFFNDAVNIDDSFIPFIPHHLKDMFDEAQRIVLNGQTAILEAPMGAEPDVKWFEFSVSPLKDEQSGEINMIMVCKDVTSRKIAEDKFRYSHEELKERNKELTILNHVHSVLANKDVRLSDAISQIVQMIPESFRFPEICSAQFLINVQKWESIDFKMGPYVISEKLNLTGNDIGEILVTYTDDKNYELSSPFLVEERDLLSMIARIIEVHWNIDIKDTAFIKSQKQLQSVMENTSVGYILLDPDLSLETCNTAAIEFANSQLKIDTSLGLDFPQILSSFNNDNLLTALKEAEEGNCSSFEYCSPHSEGSSQWYKIQISPILTGETIERLIIAIIDITKPKIEQLRIQEQLEVVEELSLITNHELRNNYSKLHAIVNLISQDSNASSFLTNMAKSLEGFFNTVDKSLNKLSQLSHSDVEIKKAVLSGDPTDFEGIIMIDDDLIILQLQEFIIRQESTDVRIESFSYAGDAIDFINDYNGSKKWLILLDLNMPRMNGWEFLDKLKIENNFHQVIVVSSSIDYDERRKALENEMVLDFFSKPLENRHLEIISSILEF